MPRSGSSHVFLFCSVHYVLTCAQDERAGELFEHAIKREHSLLNVCAHGIIPWMPITPLNGLTRCCGHAVAPSKAEYLGNYANYIAIVEKEPKKARKM